MKIVEWVGRGGDTGGREEREVDGSGGRTGGRGGGFGERRR